MPADFFIDTQLGIVFSKAVGVFTLADCLGHTDRLQSRPEFRPEFNQLFDFRRVSEVALSNDDIRRLAQRTIFSTTSRRAFVVSGDLEFGIGRMFEAYRDIAGESGIMMFREMKEALSWLSLSAEPDPSLFPNLDSPAPGR